MSLNIRLQGLRQMIGISSAFLTTSDCLSSYLLSVWCFEEWRCHLTERLDIQSYINVINVININVKSVPKNTGNQSGCQKFFCNFLFIKTNVGKVHFHSENMFQKPKKNLFWSYISLASAHFLFQLCKGTGGKSLNLKSKLCSLI